MIIRRLASAADLRNSLQRRDWRPAERQAETIIGKNTRASFSVARWTLCAVILNDLKQAARARFDDRRRH